MAWSDYFLPAKSAKRSAISGDARFYWPCQEQGDGFWNAADKARGLVGLSRVKPSLPYLLSGADIRQSMAGLFPFNTLLPAFVNTNLCSDDSAMEGAGFDYTTVLPSWTNSTLWASALPLLPVGELTIQPADGFEGSPTTDVVLNVPPTWDPAFGTRPAIRYKEHVNERISILEKLTISAFFFVGNASTPSTNYSFNLNAYRGDWCHLWLLYRGGWSSPLVVEDDHYHFYGNLPLGSTTTLNLGAKSGSRPTWSGVVVLGVAIP